uniref:Reverse transcriptase domain-containing protein n=1 Tax=Triticum urartu TaxID=4572 RepID=A0A8R7PLU5_TRIUA
MAVMLELHRNKFLSFGLLNSSIITLLHKKECSLEVADFRPINLIHGAVKIFAKVLAVRLAPLLPALVSQVQSAFISRRSIHENFKFVHNTARVFAQEESLVGVDEN